jgi:hypothetical protein
VSLRSISFFLDLAECRLLFPFAFFPARRCCHVPLITVMLSPILSSIGSFSFPIPLARRGVVAVNHATILILSFEIPSLQAVRVLKGSGAN